MKEINLKDSKYIENRELSWLEFNQRVLDEACNHDNPLFERLKFLAIVHSNLDEFFMVRVASIKSQIEVGYMKEDISGLYPQQILELLSNRIHLLVESSANHYKRTLLPLLKKEGIFIKDMDSLSKKELTFIDDYFNEFMYPVLTPLAVDSGRPFPLILNKTLNIAALIQKDHAELFVTVQVPSVLPRFVQVPSQEENTKLYVLLEDIIIHYIDRLFIGQKVLSASPYRITRDADLSFDEEEAIDLLVEIEKSIKKRKWGEAIRLELHKNMEPKLLGILYKELRLEPEDVYKIDGPIDFTFLMKMYALKGFESLKFSQYEQGIPKALMGVTDIFDAISEKDILLSHPYESFEPVVNLIQKAAKDKKVLAIKQTLYRVSGQSPIIKALAEAAEGGKQVTVLVELKARFDEENNIQWARKLEESGCHVIYGLVGLKTHSKVTLIVRKEEGTIKRYVHLGTGNYNDFTAKIYSDYGLLTCNEKIGADVSAVFNTLSGYSDPPKLHKLCMAPTGLRERFVRLIQREIDSVKDGKKGEMVLKMNSLCDPILIEHLYRGSAAGVKIDLIVRGICSLIPGIEGVSENITVRSIVGKYLEHTRVFWFYNRGQEEIFLSSADWMPRNLDRRVELMFPIEDQLIKNRIKNEMDILLSDTVKAKIKDQNGHYNRIDRRGKPSINAQENFQEQVIQNEKEYKQEALKEIFIPILAENHIDNGSSS